MIKRFIVIVALLSTVLTAAQEGTYSPYSYYGIGLTKFRGTVENQSMGGLRVFSDSIHVNLRNPAGYGKLRLTTYTAAASHTRAQLDSGQETEAAVNTSLDYLSIGIPAGRFAFGLGLIPYTSVGYRILEVNNETANRFRGRGGMNKVYLTTGFSVTRDLSLGIDLQYNFGNIQHNFLTFQEGVQFGTRQIDRTDLKGFNLNFGVDYQTKITNTLKLHAAATYAPEMAITAEQMRNVATIRFGTLGREEVTGETTVELPETTVTLPGQYTIGLGLGQVNKWFAGAEYSGLQTGAFDFNSGRTFREFSYEDASQYRLGGYYIPQYNSITSYFDRVAYRAGLRYEETGLRVAGEAINEFGISFGLGLPAGTNFSNANIGFEYGQRGTTNSGLIKENFFKLSISLSLNDKWFVQSRFD